MSSDVQRLISGIYEAFDRGDFPTVIGAINPGGRPLDACFVQHRDTVKFLEVVCAGQAQAG